MKYRQGFVSNSSSSSYLIAYDASAILSDPKEIVDYIENNLRSPIMFKSDLCEGWDIFELDMKQKNYLLKHQKRFENFSKGTVKYTDYSAQKDENGNYPEFDIPFVQALTKVYRFEPDPYEWETPEVDMSDIPCPELSLEETMAAVKPDADPELKEKLKLQSNWGQIRCQRQDEARHNNRNEYIKKTKQELLKAGADPKTLKVELVEVDYRNCDPDGTSDWEFPGRYFGLEEDTWYDNTEDSDEGFEITEGCPKCGYKPAGQVSTGHERYIFCPNCHVRTAFYPINRCNNLLRDDWEEGQVFAMSEPEIQTSNPKA